MLLRELLMELGIDPGPVETIHIEFITDDSRMVRPNTLFVAIRGLTRSGLDYLDEALAKGAAAVVSDVELECPVPSYRVVNAREALGRLLSAFYGHPSRKLTVIGVTGTNGKTTTTHMVDTILRAAGKKTGLVGTVTTRIGSEIEKSIVTTPEATELQALLSKMVHQGVEYAILEVSSHGLELDRVAGITFDTTALTNISMDHLDMHQSPAQYVSAKAKLFSLLKAGGTAVLNIDDSYYSYFCTSAKGSVVTYGLSQKAHLHGIVRSLEPDGSVTLVTRKRSMKATHSKDSHNMCLKVAGKHNIYNGLAALAITSVLGVPLREAVNSLRSFRGVTRRLQKIHQDRFTIIDDFAHNPGSIEATLQAVRLLDYDKLVVVNAVRGNRGEDINRENGRVLASLLPSMRLHRFIATTSRDVVQEKDMVLACELSAFIQPIAEAGIDIEVLVNLEDALQTAIKEAGEGTLILLLGAQGMDPAAQICHEALRKQHLYKVASPLSR